MVTQVAAVPSAAIPSVAVPRSAAATGAPRIRVLRARDVMTSPVITVNGDDSPEQARRVLTGNGLWVAPVLDEDNRLIGLVRLGDLLCAPTQPVKSGATARWLGRLRRMRCATVSDLMITPVESLTPGADAAQIEAMMIDEGIDCFSIVDGLTVAGIITRHDLRVTQEPPTRPRIRAIKIS
jgi:CBS-domain-containing membrane protein